MISTSVTLFKVDKSSYTAEVDIIYSHIDFTKGNNCTVNKRMNTFYFHLSVSSVVYKPAKVYFKKWST